MRGKFHRYWTTDSQNQSAEVLLRYDDGTIAMAKNNAGAGQLLVCNFTPHPQASNLSKHPTFVPLVHELIKNLRPTESARRDFSVGQMASVTLPKDSFQLTVDSSQSTANFQLSTVNRQPSHSPAH